MARGVLGAAQSPNHARSSSQMTPVADSVSVERNELINYDKRVYLITAMGDTFICDKKIEITL